MLKAAEDSYEQRFFKRRDDASRLFGKAYDQAKNERPKHIDREYADRSARATKPFGNSENADASERSERSADPNGKKLPQHVGSESSKIE